jgi:hypothetical protein
VTLDRRAPMVTEILTLSRRGGVLIRSTINRTLLGEVLAARWVSHVAADRRVLVAAPLKRSA